MNAMPQSGGFVPHLHIFRGIAIILIVGSHAMAFTVVRVGYPDTIDPRMPLLALAETIAHNSTLLFAFISGLLLSVALARKGWPRFFRNKALYVLLPYGFFSIIFTYYNGSLFTGFNRFQGSLADYLLQLAENLWRGQASFQFWYIPVLMILFALTPVLAALMRQTWAIYALVVLLTLPLVASRTFPENSVANILFFAAPYALGIWIGNDYEARVARLRQWRVPLLGGVLLASVVAYALYLTVTGPTVVAGEDQRGPINWYESVSYVQKMALIGFLLIWLNDRPDWRPLWLDRLATHAFAIYFVHAFVLYSIVAALNVWLVSPPSLPVQILLALFIWAAALFISLMISMGASRALGPRSRLIIGS